MWGVVTHPTVSSPARRGGNGGMLYFWKPISLNHSSV